MQQDSRVRGNDGVALPVHLVIPAKAGIHSDLNIHTNIFFKRLKRKPNAISPLKALDVELSEKSRDTQTTWKCSFLNPSATTILRYSYCEWLAIHCKLRLVL